LVIAESSASNVLAIFRTRSNSTISEIYIEKGRDGSTGGADCDRKEGGMDQQGVRIVISSEKIWRIG
jgi:hypothetical protein